MLHPLTDFSQTLKKYILGLYEGYRIYIIPENHTFKKARHVYYEGWSLMDIFHS